MPFSIQMATMTAAAMQGQGALSLADRGDQQQHYANDGQHLADPHPGRQARVGPRAVAPSDEEILEGVYMVRHVAVEDREHLDGDEEDVDHHGVSHHDSQLLDRLLACVELGEAAQRPKPE